MYNQRYIIKMTILPRLLFLFQWLPEVYLENAKKKENRHDSSPKTKEEWLYPAWKITKQHICTFCFDLFFLFGVILSVMPNGRTLNKENKHSPSDCIRWKEMTKWQLGKLNNWTAAPLNVWHKKLIELKLERNAQILRWVVYLITQALLSTV